MLEKKIESEKYLDKKLVAKIKSYRGLCLKMHIASYIGFPDRLCLLPNAVIFFAEMKTTGQKPTKIQLEVHKKLISLGFKVLVIDNSEDIKNEIWH